MYNEDPEMLNEDGSLNLCLDCINVDYTNPKHVADAARLINEGYTTGTHRNEKVFREALNQFGIPEPLYKSTPLEQKQYGGDMQMIGQYGGYTGSKDPSIPALTRFIQGGYDQFPEESKNVNDPYFSDMTPYPQMQNGGDPTKYTHYTHGADDVFHDNMNMTVKAQDGMQVGGNPYLQQLQQMLQNSKYSPRDIRRGMRNQRRMSGNTYRDLLFPANRAIQYSGSWAQQMGLPFLGENGETYLGDVNGPLAKREVTKKGILGRPKEWTDYYMVGDDGSFSSLDPSNTNKITLDPYKQRVAAENKANDKALQPRGTYRDLGLINQARIRSNERQADRRTSNEPDVDPGYEPMSNEEMLKSQGKVWSEQQKRWVQKNSQRDAIINAPDQQSNIHSFPGPDMSNIPSGTNVGQDEALKALFNSRMAYGGFIPTYMAYGGYLQKATFGLENTPVSYTDNPAFEGQTEVDMTVNNDGNTNLEPSSFWGDQQSFNTQAPAAPKEMQQQNEELTKYKVDPNQIEEYQAPKQFQGLVGVKRKRQDMTTIDPEAGVNTFNAGVKGALGAIDNMRSRKQEADMYAKNFDPTQVYGKKERIDKGDWDVNTGMYRTNETGANRLGRSKKFGGYMQEGGVPEGMFYPEDNIIYPPGDSQYPMVPLNQDIMDMMYNQYYSDPNFMPYEEDPYMEEAPEETDYRMVAEGGETYMSDEQINAFLAAGGEIEYL